MNTNVNYPSRCVHLDFHTSPLIPDVGVEFDPPAFAETFRRARVDSVTVFARCHHGMTYFPSQVTARHPGLGERDLLGEMVEALHRVGIRAPIYTSVAWDEYSAQHRPSWQMLDAQGRAVRSLGDAPGRWRFIDWLNPEYLDLLEAHVREVFHRYDVDGMFFDILFYPIGAHHSQVCRDFRQREGFRSDDDETFHRFQAAAQLTFYQRFTRLIQGLKCAATVFYNSGFDIAVDGSGGRERADACSHLEIESLPSGFWGYYHFPRLARGAGRWGKPWLGMTGRFQHMWGDFGGIRPVAALEYDCFRAQALGGGNSVGDQLPPRGALDQAAYDLIGAVYEKCAAADPFYAGSVDCARIGIVTANHPARSPEQSARSDEGAVLMCDELHYDTTLIDERSNLDAFELVILPDACVVTPRLELALREFSARGGKLLVSQRGGRNALGDWVLDFLPLEFDGDEPTQGTSYWRARPSFWPEMSRSDRVIYETGSNVVEWPGLEVWVDRVLPYFQRTDSAFCSHFQTPPQAKTAGQPAVVAGDGFVYFADPVFREYREQGNAVIRPVLERALRHLIGGPLCGEGLPTTMEVLPRRRGRDLIVTLLHYVPIRKSTTIDLLEERMSFAGERLHLPPGAQAAREFQAAEALPRDEAGATILPLAKGRLLIEVPDYF